MVATKEHPSRRWDGPRPPARPELIAPGSALHSALADAVVGIYGLPLFVAPLLHPATAEGTATFDPTFNRDDRHLGHYLLRLRDTIDLIGGVVYGGKETDHISWAIRELHRDIGGTLPTGEDYHAWSRDTWAWNWAAILAAVMDVYAAFRGFPDDDFRDEVYLGLLEVGRRFGVAGLPETYARFAAKWPSERDRVAVTESSTMQRLIGLIDPAGLPAAPGAFRHLPPAAWAALTAPLRHAWRVSLVATLTEHHAEQLGLRITDADRRLVRRHQAVWRLVPRRATHLAGLAYFQVRRHLGTPAWRSRFSATALRGENASNTSAAGLGEGRRVEVLASDGARLAVHAWGPADAPTVLLVHGFPDDHTVWQAVAAALVDEFHVVALDTRGSGRSDKPTAVSAYRLDQLADDLAGVADAVSPDRPVHLVGHDWGSVQAWHAATDPARRRRLASLTSISGPPLDAVPRWIVGNLASTAGRRAVAGMWKSPLYMGALMAPGLGPLLCRTGIVDHAVTWAHRFESGPRAPGHDHQPARRHQAAVRIYRANLPRLARPEPRATTIPVQVLCPRRDVFITPRSQQAALVAAPHAHIEELDGGHWAPAGIPDAISDRIRTWVHDLEQVSPAPEGRDEHE